MAQSQTAQIIDSPDTALALKTEIDTLVGRLERLASDQVSKKIQIEDRWVKDLRQYHGRYEPDVESALISDGKSRLFINETRAKTHSWEARLSDMLFPNDEDNWGIKPTPVPELMGAASLVPAGSDDSVKIKEIMKLAKARSDAMKAEIKDQLREAQYNIKCRDVIHDACKMGCGIIKGPTVNDKVRRKYEEVVDSDDDGNVIELQPGQPKRVWRLTESEDPRPGWERVDPFNYFPDMSARNVDEAEFHFERHILTKKQLRNLARKPGFNKESIREILQGQPRDQIPDYLTKLRDITGSDQQSLPDKYHVWEYHGPIEPQELRSIAMSQLSGQAQIDLLNDLQDVDPLDEQSVVVWFSDGRLLKYGPTLLETGDPPYSAFCFERDDTNIFGFGVPYLLRDSQAAMNAAWRMSMDNAGLSVGPQVVINREIVQPANGNWDLEPRKIWYRTKNLPYPVPAFETFHIDSRQTELSNIIDMAQRFGDDETNMPMIAQGEQGASTRQTASGMSILMNSVNVVFRRVVKNFDDQMTVPNIRRAYDWNMAFSRKDAIKGDFEADARGSSVLLVRELQAQNLMTMVTSFSDHPVLGPMTKVPEMYRKLVQAHMLPANEIVMSDDEIEVKRQEESAQPPPPDPEMIKLETQMNISTIESNARLEIAKINQETAMMSLAEKSNMTLEQLKAKIQVGRDRNQSEERKLAVEVAMAEKNPEQRTGGSV